MESTKMLWQSGKSDIEEKSERKKKPSKTIGWFVLVMISVLLGVVLAFKFQKGPEEIEFLTSSSLLNIVEIAELDSFETIYRGVAEVRNSKKQDQIDWCVYYEAR